MDSTQPPAASDGAAEQPQPEVLKPRADDGSSVEPPPSTAGPVDPKAGGKKLRRRTYRPSHKATFISLAVIISILAINAGVLAFVLKRQAKVNQQNNDQVTINQSALDKLGVNRSSVGDSGVLLTIGPNTQFNNKVDVAGDVNISGQLKLNSKFTATDASLAQLEAGKTALTELNVNGDSTSSSLSLRSDLLVQGSTRLQGAVTISKLLTVYNNLNVAGNLSIGGTFSARSLASTASLTIGGHIITTGSAPSVTRGGSVGTNGTVSISGNDAAGTVGVNLGTGGGGGNVATVTFNTAYDSVPHVTITPIGNVGSFYISSRSASGFTIAIATSHPTGGGFSFDYIVAQ